MTWAQCFDQARAQSRRESRAEMLHDLLTQRFGALPPDIEAMIDQSSVEQIDVWARRFVRADSLKDVFRPSSPAP